MPTRRGPAGWRSPEVAFPRSSTIFSESRRRGSGPSPSGSVIASFIEQPPGAFGIVGERKISGSNAHAATESARSAGRRESAAQVLMMASRLIA